MCSENSWMMKNSLKNSIIGVHEFYCERCNKYFDRSQTTVYKVKFKVKKYDLCLSCFKEITFKTTSKNTLIDALTFNCGQN